MSVSSKSEIVAVGAGSCLIFGASAVGLLCAVAARATGWKDIVIADINQGRLQYALENGFASTTYAVEPKRGAVTEEEMQIAKDTATMSGGSVLLIGLGIPNHVLPISEATVREITLIPNWRHANAYPKAIEIALASVTRSLVDGVKLPDVRRLITHRYSGVKGIPEALDMAGWSNDSEGKLVVNAVINF
ncbi:hypothetical protein B7463_g7084, partial [Scytalidium lignicola]